MKQRTLERVISPAKPHFVGDGFRVHNFIPGTPSLSMQRMDPFIMMDYNSKHHFAASDRPKGVGVHPHRGFETVTIAYQGKVEHHDSAGGGGIIGEGDVQWMTAAKGVLHKEYHEREWSKQGGIFQMVQLWVNLPKKDKMNDPRYQAINQEAMTKVPLPNDGGILEVIAGSYKDNIGPAKTFSPIQMYNARLNQGAQLPLQFSKHFNTTLLVVEGIITINDQHKISTDHLALMANDGEDFRVHADEDAIVLVLSGEPINEPIAAHGPFVMNTREELVQAFQDFNTGKFGYLEE